RRSHQQCDQRTLATDPHQAQAVGAVRGTRDLHRRRPQGPVCVQADALEAALKKSRRKIARKPATKKYRATKHGYDIGRLTTRGMPYGYWLLPMGGKALAVNVK